ncbi:MAG: putative Ntn-hydrolase superfamily protein, partial [Salinirussus sp.]
ATAAAYEAGRGDERPLAGRLVDALAAGHEEGGDRREELHVQSAALRVRRTDDPGLGERPFYQDLRVDATETPVADLRETYELAREGDEMAMERAAEREEGGN